MNRTSVTEAVVPRMFHFAPGESDDETMDLVVLCEPYPGPLRSRELETEFEELLNLRTASL